MSRPRILPPAGVSVSTSVTEVDRKKPWLARARWVDPATKQRRSTSATFFTEPEADDWVAQIEKAAKQGVDPAMATATLAKFGEANWKAAMRGVDPNTAGNPYLAGWRKRIVPDLGHLPVRTISNGVIDRAVMTWIEDDGAGKSTVKNTLACLKRVMQVAVRDGIREYNPADVRGWQKLYTQIEDELDDPRSLALPDWDALEQLATALIARSHDQYQGWGDVVIFAASTAARIGEVSGVRVKDIDRDTWIWTVRRQTTSGPGGLIDKPTKGRRARQVPIMPWLQPHVAQRLDVLKDKPDARLYTGPLGGRIKTAVLRDATHWDEVVESLGYPWLKRHGLRHTGLTWMADAGILPHDLQRIAGHGSFDTTKRYLHSSLDSVVAAGERLNMHLHGASGTPSLRVVRS